MWLNNNSHQLIDAVKAILFQITDELVRFNSDPMAELIVVSVFGHVQTLFILVTNRLGFNHL